MALKVSHYKHTEVKLTSANKSYFYPGSLFLFHSIFGKGNTFGSKSHKSIMIKEQWEVNPFSFDHKYSIKEK